MGPDSPGRPSTPALKHVSVVLHLIHKASVSGSSIKASLCPLVTHRLFNSQLFPHWVLFWDVSSLSRCYDSARVFSDVLQHDMTTDAGGFMWHPVQRGVPHTLGAEALVALGRLTGPSK